MDANKNYFCDNFDLLSFLLGKYLNNFALNINVKTSKFFRIINEIPTIILIVVVFVVIFKPL